MDVRKDAFLTDDGASPVPAARVTEQEVSVATYELQNAITQARPSTLYVILHAGTALVTHRTCLYAHPHVMHGA